MPPLPKLRRYFDWRHWIRGLVSAVIQGGCGAVLGAGGLLGGNLVGAPVQPLDYKQAGGVFLGAAIIRLLFYLLQNPFPPDVETTANAQPFDSSKNNPPDA